jgi:fatty-acyl-CoA synthase
MFPDFIESQALSIPDRQALWFNDKWFTYADLNHRAHRLAQRLRAFDIRRGDRVGIISLNHIAHVDLMLAATKLGHVHMPLNHRLGLDSLRLLVGRVTPSLVLVDAVHEPLAKALGIAWLLLSDYEAWLAEASEAPLARAADLSPDDLHMILFTGGSTGIPKGACLPYRQTLGNAADTVSAWELQADDCVIQCTPCFHAAVNVLCLPLLLAGGRVVLVPKFEPASYLALAQAHSVSLLFMVPTMYRALVVDPAFETTSLPRLRCAITGGAPCPPNLRDRFAARGIDLRLGYGMTEAGVNCFRITAEEAARHPGSVGRPMPGIELRLRREDGSVITEPGEVGEITMTGPQICRGYFCHEDDDAAAQGFRDGWLWSGDLAAFDADGLFTIRGRRKDMYISGGENIHPAEIETALLQCAGILDCTVFGWPHPKWGECGIALVVNDPASPLDLNTLRAELRTRVGGYKLPAEILLVPMLPRSAAGKLLKTEARALYAQSLAAASPINDMSAAA